MNKKSIVLFLLIIVCCLSIGCQRVDKGINTVTSLAKKQRVVVVVTDKASKMPIKDAKIHILGEEGNYVTDAMGKTNEFEVELKSDYFDKGTEAITTKISCGFTSLVVKAEGYSSHLETDYSVFPGDSISIIKLEIQKGKDSTVKANAPDIMYIEDLIKEYEKAENKEVNNENAIAYVVKVIDEKKNPIEGVRLVVPEGRLVNLTDKKGEAKLLIPKEFINNLNHTINKGYGEFTLLAYREGFATKAIFKVHVNKTEKDNKLTLKMKKTEKPLMEYSVVKPGLEWVKSAIEGVK